MMRNSIKAVIALCTLAIAPTMANAQNCENALVPDVVNLSNDTQRNLVLLDQRIETATNTNNTGIVAMYEGIGLNVNQARQMSSTLNRLLQVNYSESQRHALYVSSLSGNALQAYLACISQDRDITYHFGGADILGRESFILSVGWSPNPQPAEAITEGTILIAQGGQEPRTITFPIRQGQALVPITRDPFIDAQIGIQIGTVTELIDLPAASRFRIVQETLEGPMFETMTRESSGDIGGNICVFLPNDETIAMLPGSFHLREHIVQLVRARRVDDPVVQTERSACQFVHLIFETVFSSFIQARINGYVTVLKAVPVQ